MGRALQNLPFVLLEAGSASPYLPGPGTFQDQFPRPVYFLSLQRGHGLIFLESSGLEDIQNCFFL